MKITHIKLRETKIFKRHQMKITFKKKVFLVDVQSTNGNVNQWDGSSYKDRRRLSSFNGFELEEITNEIQKKLRFTL
jgi:hypothetical protein